MASLNTVFEIIFYFTSFCVRASFNSHLLLSWHATTFTLLPFLVTFLIFCFAYNTIVCCFYYCCLII